MRFEDFAAARMPALLRYAVLLTGDRELARDIVQEVLTRALLRWRRIGGFDEPYAYVRTMVTNEYLTLRRRKTFKTVPLDHHEHGRDPGSPDAAGRIGEHQEMWQLLGTLPRQHRAVLVLRYYEGLTDDEIAHVLGCRPATVRGYASRALAALRVDLKPLSTEGRKS